MKAHGHWKIDVDATVRLNPLASQAMLLLFSKDASENPFVLTVTEKDFITTSRLKRIEDTYEVIGTEKGVVTLRLTSKDRPEAGSRPPLKMQPKGDRLLLDYREVSSSGLLVVFVKARAEEIQHPPKQ